MIKIYLASGSFTKNTKESLKCLENLLDNMENVNLYSPLRDGIKLEENEFHKHELRKKIFQENIDQINSSDILVVNLDSRDGFYDTGTCYELGYAMSKNIPVFIYDPAGNYVDKFGCIDSGFVTVANTITQMKSMINMFIGCRIPGKLLFVAPDTSDEQIQSNCDIISTVILESHGSNFRVLDNLSHLSIYDNIEEIFGGVEYMVAVIDDRHPIVSWMMGQAYERNIPIISYTNYDYGVNIMLACSILTHCKGKEELRKTIQRIKREGINSFSEYDTSNLKAY